MILVKLNRFNYATITLDLYNYYSITISYSTFTIILPIKFYNINHYYYSGYKSNYVSNSIIIFHHANLIL
jgi:hypothetical protein